MLALILSLSCLYLAICWAIVLARLIEAMYNIWIGNSKCFLRISVDDLVSKIKAEDDDKEITTLNRCIKVIEVQGIKKVPTTSHVCMHFPYLPYFDFFVWFPFI